ncbi:MAG: NAD(P)/FAD-dependent oxidoreductase [Candidatus Woesearchaeota archaeon]
MKIAIIGAGPAGNFSAYLLSKLGHEVYVFEKDKEIGKPIQCSGILSDYFLNFLEPKKDFVLNEIKRTRIYSPNGKCVDAKIKKNYVVCRYKFDNYLANLAKKEKAKYFLEHSFKRYEKIDLDNEKDRKEKRNSKEKLILYFNNNGKEVSFEADILIGADGPLSEVGKQSSLIIERQNFIGTQIQAYMKNDNVVEFYPYIGCYAWIIPVNKKIIRIGVVSYKNSVSLFKEFARKKIGDFEKKIIEYQSGIIPVFNPNVKLQTKDNKVFLLGDASTLVKATTGGGINQSLKAATILYDCFKKNKLKDYEKEIKRKMFFELKAHLIAHKIMQKFSYRDWNELIEVFSNEKVKKILYLESRDKITKMLFKILKTKPTLLKYIKYISLKELKILFS